MNATVTELPDMVAVLDAIDLQLTADSNEVVLPRDDAELVAPAPSRPGLDRAADPGDHHHRGRAGAVRRHSCPA